MQKQEFGKRLGEPVLDPIFDRRDDRIALSVDEAAAALGISRSLAFDAVRRKEIPAVRVGRRWLIPRAALEAMLLPARRSGARGRDDVTGGVD